MTIAKATFYNFFHYGEHGVANFQNQLDAAVAETGSSKKRTLQALAAAVEDMREYYSGADEHTRSAILLGWLPRANQTLARFNVQQITLSLLAGLVVAAGLLFTGKQNETA